MIFVDITINSFSQRGYEIIELLCFEILGGTLVYGGFSGGTFYAGGTCTERMIGPNFVGVT